MWAFISCFCIKSSKANIAGLHGYPLGDAFMRVLTKKEAKQIKKLLKKGVDVPEICQEFNIPPAEWREVVVKNDLF